MRRKRVDAMGLFERARNITDTNLRILVAESSDPEEALRHHILSLEESQRQLRGSEEVMESQRQWLESSAERKLNLAEEWQRRAEAEERQGRADLATHAVERKQELMRSMGEDRRQLETLRPQLEETSRRLEDLREKVRKARAAREQLFGETPGAGPTES
jgi:phage shock protein A